MAKASSIPVETLRQLLSYDPETGGVTWKQRPRTFFSNDAACQFWNARHAGKPALTSKSGDYPRGAVLGVAQLAHRVGWAIATGAWPSGDIDHINGDITDNRLINLRDVDAKANGKNRAISLANKSGFNGVSWAERAKKWTVFIKVDGKSIYLGYFADINDAIAARKAADKKFGFHPNHGRS